MSHAIILTLIIPSFALITFLFFLIRHLILRRRNNITVASVISPVPAASALSSNHSDHNFNDLNSLPLFTYSSVSNLNSTNSSDCAVCLAEFEPQDTLRLLPICCHAFHSSCIDTWLLSNRTCPLCRCEIFTSEDEILDKVLAASLASAASFRVEVGSVSSRRIREGGESRIRSFRYVVEGENGVISERESNVNGLGESRRSWLDRVSSVISSRTVSFRGSSRREFWDVEANRVGEEITETFRWLSGV